jgi:hypothetical protein
MLGNFNFLLYPMYFRQITKNLMKMKEPKIRRTSHKTKPGLEVLIGPYPTACPIP